MGHLLKRLTYQASNRRISLPFAWLRQQQLEPGAPVWITASAHLRLIYHASQWELLQATAALIPASAPLQSLLARGEQALLGTTGRLVLPRTLAFDSTDEKLSVGWEIVGGALLLRGPELPMGAQHFSSELPVSDIETPQISAIPEMDTCEAEPERLQPSQAIPDGLKLPSPVKRVKLGDIAGFDPDYEPDDVDPQLQEDIALQGMQRPVVLMGSRPLRVVDGQRRLRVAQALKMPEVPALVFNSLSREDLARMRYLLETTSDRWNVARQLRSLSRLYLNGATLEQLANLLRKNKRTIQRYLRIAAYPTLVEELEAGTLTLQEAEKRLGRSAHAEPSDA
ncbi:MAG: ParB/RepB/Spo0J family partition protein [Myxococcota bacterium]